jgi:dolichol-phosphate mannosyltransferase
MTMLQAGPRLGTCLILPTFNEAENLERLVTAIRGLGRGIRVLVVDDDSPDGTGEIADALAQGRQDTVVLHRTGRRGYGEALANGIHAALAQGVDAVLTMDSDFSHDPAAIPLLLEALSEADLVIGSRYVPGGGVRNWNALRRAISRGGCVYAQAFLWFAVRDSTAGFRCFRREVLEAIALDRIDSKGYAFQIETTFRAVRKGFRVAEVPIVFTDRAEGSSKMSRGIVAEAVWKVPALRVAALFRRL